MNSQLFVGKYYDMDPQTEDLIGSGKDLKNGMVVLIEDPVSRANITDAMSPMILDAAKVNNRWAEVTDLSRNYQQGVVRFVAVYGDGTKRSRMNGINTGWYVKKDSVPAE